MQVDTSINFLRHLEQALKIQSALSGNSIMFARIAVTFGPFPRIVIAHMFWKLRNSLEVAYHYDRTFILSQHIS